MCIWGWKCENIQCIETSACPRPYGTKCTRYAAVRCLTSWVWGLATSDLLIQLLVLRCWFWWAWPFGREADWDYEPSPRILPACLATPQVQCLQQRGRHSQCGFFRKFFFKWKKFEKVSLFFSLIFSLKVAVLISVKQNGSSWIFGPFSAFEKEYKRKVFKCLKVLVTIFCSKVFTWWQITVDQKCSGELRRLIFKVGIDDMGWKDDTYFSES